MVERSATLMETLLGLHRERDPQSVLQLLLRGLAPEYGRAIACCYLIDQTDGDLRLDMLDDGAGDAARTLRQFDLRAPFMVPRATGAPALMQLAESGVPVHVTEQVPTILAELWGHSVAGPIQKALGVRFTAVAPIVGVQGPSGVLMLFALDPWPIDVAAECAAHAAVAIANVCERRGSVTAAERDADTGLHARSYVEQAAAREINRADRYRRVLSVAVIELPAKVSDDDLKKIAGSVTHVMRIPDTAARLDSDRLVVLLPETPAGGASAFLRRLREHAGPDSPIVSAAAATFPQDGRTWDDLIRAAMARRSQAEAPTILGASVRGGLRGAFPSLRGGSPERPGRFSL